MANAIPAPYDGKNGMRTVTAAMAELRAFRATQPAHDLSVLKRRYPVKTNPETETQEPAQPQEPVKPAKRKRKE